MMLDGVHIYVDERGLVEELGDLAVTVDAQSVPLTTVKGLGPHRDTVCVYSREPAPDAIKPGTRALWVNDDGTWNDRTSSLRTDTNSEKKTDEMLTIEAQRTDALLIENEQLRAEIERLKVRVENTKARNKRLEGRLADLTKSTVTPDDA